MSTPDSKLVELAAVIQTVHRLRAPGGCPWDRKQTHHSLRPYLIEEAYEALDALDAVTDSAALQNPAVNLPLQEELGDVLLQVLLHSEMASEIGAFDISAVAKTLREKLIRRHPHVFGDAAAANADDALAQWEKQKKEEKARKSAIGEASALDGMPRSLPALQKAARVIEKVTKVGFQWPDLQGPLGKVDEEWRELRTEIDALQAARSDVEKTAARERVAQELGDLLFTLANVGHLLGVAPEDALRAQLARFERRFRYMERRLHAAGKEPSQSSLAEMDTYWDEAKRREKTPVWGLTGGIGAGKSTAARLLAKHPGVTVLDADAIVRELSAPGGAAHAAIQKEFGTADRAAIAQRVFNDAGARQKLEAILHPRVRAAGDARIAELLASPQPPRLIVYEASLLLEAGRGPDFDGVLLISAPEAQRIARAASRDQVEEAQILARAAAQWDDATKRAHATRVIENTGDETTLAHVLDAWIREILA